MLQCMTPPPLTPFDPATMIQSLDESGHGLRVVFYRPDDQKDRFGHIIGIVTRGTATPILPSVELDGKDGWPASPPLQSLSIEQRPQGAVALAVGMSGQSHWSASVEAVSGERRLIFDIACRLGAKTEPQLRSYYLVNRRLRVLADSLLLPLPKPHHGNVRIGLDQTLTAELDSAGLMLCVRSNHQPVRSGYTVEVESKQDST